MTKATGGNYQHMKTKFPAHITLLALALSLSNSGQAQSDIAERLEEARTTIEKWVDARQLISKERSKWREQNALIGYKIGLFKSETEALNERIEDYKEKVTRAEADRSRFAAEEATLRAAARVVKGAIHGYEIKLLALSKRFPQPLTDKIAPLVKQLPEDESKTKLSVAERVAIIVGILNEVDKFNANITVQSELRTIGSGATIEVKTLYLGLAQAFFVSANKEHAEVGTPGSDGWDWTESNDHALEISRMIAMYENIIKPATFVELPITISE